MPQCGGLWKGQNNLLGTKNVRVFIMLNLDIIRKKKKNDAPVYSVTSFEASHVGCVCVKL